MAVFVVQEDTCRTSLIASLVKATLFSQQHPVEQDRGIDGVALWVVTGLLVVVCSDPALQKDRSATRAVVVAADCGGRLCPSATR